MSEHNSLEMWSSFQDEFSLFAVTDNFGSSCWISLIMTVPRKVWVYSSVTISVILWFSWKSSQLIHWSSLDTFLCSWRCFMNKEWLELCFASSHSVLFGLSSAVAELLHFRLKLGNSCSKTPRRETNEGLINSFVIKCRSQIYFKFHPTILKKKKKSWIIQP